MSSEHITLKYPVDHKGDHISTIEMRRPKVKDMLTVDKINGDMQKGIRMMSNLSGHPETVFHEMDMEDMKTCNDVLASFLGESPAAQ